MNQFKGVRTFVNTNVTFCCKIFTKKLRHKYLTAL